MQKKIKNPQIFGANFTYFFVLIFQRIQFTTIICYAACWWDDCAKSAFIFVGGYLMIV
jgi:hypothetical protein